MKDALDIHRELLSHGVAHEIVRLTRPITDADELPTVTGLPADRCAVVRHYLTDSSTLVATIVPAGRQPHPGMVMQATGSLELEPAPAGLVNRVTDYATSLAAPFLLPAEVTVLMDMSLLLPEVVYTATGDSGTALGIPSAALASHTRATLLALCGRHLDLARTGRSGGLAPARPESPPEPLYPLQLAHPGPRTALRG